VFEKKAVGESIQARTSKRPKHSQKHEAQGVRPLSWIDTKDFSKNLVQLSSFGEVFEPSIIWEALINIHYPKKDFKYTFKFMESKRVGFFGFGHMAQILCEGIQRAKLIPNSQISFLRRDRDKMKENSQKFHITATSLGHLVSESDLIVLAMRPQQVEDALKQLVLAGNLEGKWIVSILAGKPISFFQAHLGAKAQILRTMPNLCSAVGEGMSALCYSENCTEEFRSFGRLFFGASGEIAEVAEKFMDLVVGMSGSGPAFVIRLIETMARTGVAHGMDPTTALKIAAQTFAGAAKLILKGKTSPQDLLSQITVPNGTTQAGLTVMTELEMDPRFRSVIEAAAKRSHELSK
jgi:pyrroline-5-carboxylate reductase